MADTITDANERVGAHVRKVLRELVLKGRPRAGPSPDGSLALSRVIEKTVRPT
jgi:hypothetical protein